MAQQDNSFGTSLADQKIVEEIEKLRLEKAKLRESAWRTPATLVAIGGLILSLLGNFIQFRAGKISAATADRQQQLSEAKWAEERVKLQADIEFLQTKAQNAIADRSAVQQELNRVNKNIDVWDSALLKDNLDLMRMQSELSTYEISNRTAMAEATRKNIELQKNMIKMKTEEKNAEMARRSELEKQRN